MFRPFHTSTPWGSLLPTYPPYFVKKYLNRGQRYAPKRNLKRTYGGGILLSVPIFGDLPVYDPTKFPENRSTRAAELYAIQLFLYLPANLHRQRHNGTVPSCRPSIVMWAEKSRLQSADFGFWWAETSNYVNYLQQRVDSDIAPLYETASLHKHERSDMAHVVNGSHSFTCTPAHTFIHELNK